MIFSPPPRNLRAELLDLDEAPYEEVRESLGDVRRVNRYLSGYRVLLHHAGIFLRAHKKSRPVTILDVATGSADQPVALAELARKLGVPVRIQAIDINFKMLKFAREMTARFPEIELVQCDVLALPFRENSFDLVINSLSLHHFSWEKAVAILTAIYKISRYGFIVNDLHRSRIAHAAIFLLTRLLTKNRLTRFDAPVSVMNAFTPAEFFKLAREAGIPQFEIHRHFPYRIALVGNKKHS
ncbi:MAG: methyltransferase domain-containing protein [Nitrospinae bacterium]|jgi:SAM-dependent methyltransferase|nr:methyltransferase domain-containing protein [Nitrospinota bacterium]MDA1108645.1 methyltransferase domain-containing protein [Nitrospinota bacterium]